jgi:hypothetical protein
VSMSGLLAYLFHAVPRRLDKSNCPMSSESPLQLTNLRSEWRTVPHANSVRWTSITGNRIDGVWSKDTRSTEQ